jgi:hypothetical protein
MEGVEGATTAHSKIPMSDGRRQVNVTPRWNGGRRDKLLIKWMFCQQLMDSRYVMRGARGLSSQGNKRLPLTSGENLNNSHRATL